MASLLTKPDDDASLNTSTAGAAGGSSSGSTASPTPLTPTTGIGNQQDVSKITGLNQGVNFSALLNPLRDQRTAALGAIDSANKDFTSDLGQTKVFGQDQQDALSRALSGQAPLADGQSLLNSSQTINPINHARYDPLVARYTTSANQTASDTGLNGLIQGLRPDLTPGERNFDALNFENSPKAQQQSRAFMDDANNMNWLAGNTTQNAANATTQRQADIGAFNKAGSDYVSSQANSINDAVNSMAQKANQTDTQTAMDYGYLQQNTNAGPFGMKSGPTGINWNNIPQSELTFDRSPYVGQTIQSSQYDPSVYSKTFDPSRYMIGHLGDLANRNNVATDDQRTRYNNAQSLLGGNDRLVAPLSPHDVSSVGFNQNQWFSDLAQAMKDRDAADAAHTAAIKPPEPDLSALLNLFQPDVNGFGSTGDSG